MNKEQLIADIEAKRLLVKSCKEQFRQAESDLALLEVELAEAGKPKLQHGDIRLWHESVNKLVSIIDLSDSHPHAIWDGDGLRNKWTEEQILSRSNSIGNIKEVFADLKGLAEPLKDFRVNGIAGGKLHVFFLASGNKNDNLYLEVGDAGGNILANINISLNETVKQLCRLAATAERDNEKTHS